MALTADFDSSFSARLSGQYTPSNGLVRPFRFDRVTVFGSGNFTGNLDFGSGGLLHSDVDLRFGDGLDHVLGVFAGEQPSGLDTVVFSGAFAAQTGYVAPPPEPPDPPPPATPEIAATLDCSAANVCRGDNVDADDVRRAWNDPDTIESALRLRELRVDDRDGRQVEGLARRLGRYTPPLQSMARGNTQYYRGEDGLQYHFGRSGGAGSLDIELDFSGAGDGLSAEAKASMRRAAKLWSWTLADDGRTWYWSPNRDGQIPLADSVVSVERPAGRETGVVIAVAEPTRTLSAGRESTIGAARPESAYSTSTSFRAKTGVLWLSSRLTDLAESGTPGATAGIISVTAHEKWDGRLPPLMFEVGRDEWTLAGRRHQSAKVEEQALHGQTGGSEMKTNRTVVGVDTAKRVFQLHWVDMETGEVVDIRLTRAKFLEHFANRVPCVVAMEACGGSQHWARRLRELGHDPWLLPAKAVRPFVSGNKNDAHDARAIWTAAQMPGIKTVAVKSEEQQAILALHRMRQQLVKFRTAQINGLRGLLTEYGEVMPQGRVGMRRGMAEALDRVAERLPAMMIDTLREQWARVGQLDGEIAEIERRIALWHRSNPDSQRVAEIPGVGVLTATAVVAAMGDPAAFRSGREFAAWLGLVPRHDGTGGRVRMLGISKRGDRYLRTLLIHGARSVLTNAKAPPEWAVRLAAERQSVNVATVALANKTARTIWALLAHDRAYRADFVSQPA